MVISGSVKCDVNGNIEWEKTYGGPLSDTGHTLLLTKDNHIVIAGGAQMNGYTVNCNLQGSLGDVWLLEIDLNGNVISQHCYGGSNHEIGIHFLELNNGYIFAGIANSDDGDGFRGYMVSRVKTNVRIFGLVN